MGKKLLPFILLTILSVTAFSQKYYTRNGYVRFFSATPIENIEAVNNQVSCIVDIETGEVISKLLMEAFHFEKALMQEHFNENYVESDKFPQAVLKGKITNFSSISHDNPGKQDLLLNADLTIHGVTKNMDIKLTVDKENGQPRGQAIFIVKPSDFDIKIPKAVANNIAKEIEVTVKFELEPLKK